MFGSPKLQFHKMEIDYEVGITIKEELLLSECMEGATRVLIAVYCYVS